MLYARKIDRIDALALPTHAPLTRAQHGLSFAELTLGAAIVVGHNVFHVLPNEVPILFVLALASIRLREGSWRDIGLGRPKSWLLTIAVALGAAFAVIAAKLLIAQPLGHLLGLHAVKSAGTSLGLHKNNIWSLRRKAKYRGLEKVAWTFTPAAAAYNLIRLPKLMAAA